MKPKDVCEEYIYDDYFIRVMSDYSYGDPRDAGEHEVYSKFICIDRKYQVGDKHNYTLSADTREGWNKLKEDIIKREDVAAICPIYLYEKPNQKISLSLAPFQDYWKSYQVGFALIEKKKVEEAREKLSRNYLEARQILWEEMDKYNDYLDERYPLVYYIDDIEGQTCFSEYGFDDVDEAVFAAQHAIDHTIKKNRK